MTARSFLATTLRYGPHPDQVADLYVPDETSRPAPLVIFLHGGFWRAQADRAHTAVVAEDLAARGYAVANTEYRRIGSGGGWPGTFLDVAAALDVLPAMAGDAADAGGAGGAGGIGGCVDPTRVVYMGHSAGGHLALWGALRHRIPEGGPGRLDAAPRVAGVVALAPAADLVWAHALGSGRGAVFELLEGGPAEFPDRFAVADPTSLGVPEAPVTIVHGDRDEALPAAMAREYAARVGARARAVVPEGVGHFDLIDPGSAAWPVVVEALGRVLA